jgi:hypothetical protein
MTKYYFILVLVVASALVYIFFQDPCNNQLRGEFAKRYPSYEILDSGSREGSPDEVKCYIRYRKPDSKQAYEDVWMYQNSESGWSFSSMLETQKPVQMP